MSWLSRRLEALDGLGRERDRLTAAAARGQVGEALAREAREAFAASLEGFASEVGERDQVVACVVAREGLVVASAGRAPDGEMLAAVSQVWLTAGTQGAARLGLGALHQMVVVGDAFKVALFRVGGVAVAILAPAASDLGEVLA
jgi:predicted regulator of Ras-like GTPase activity (Roadblock/LC7/MglB family)